MTDEQTIIKNIIDGDIELFRLLTDRYQKPVMRMIRNIINDRHICEDVAQEVFFTAYKKLKTFDNSQSKFSTWLFTIARNKSLNAIKKKKLPLAGELSETVISNETSDNLETQEFYNELDRQLNLLPHNQKTVFVLSEFEKLSYEEISQIERVRIGTVKTRLHRAKKKLAKALSFDWNI